ncbi:unnamed protein product [Pedinophyceae sp. YPF-701]|nr:unnamed protein product [Pedinophyceae sp. YPF-701]
MAAAEKVASAMHEFRHQGRVVYRWRQTVEEVEVFLDTPPGVRAAHLDVSIKPRHLTIGIKGNPPYLDHELGGQVNVSESTWTLDGGCLTVELSKVQLGVLWPAAFQGHQLDGADLEADKKSLMLQRFQMENPGMDFSGAAFNGEVPDSATFMGGMRRS